MNSQYMLDISIKYFRKHIHVYYHTDILNDIFSEKKEDPPPFQFGVSSLMPSTVHGAMNGELMLSGLGQLASTWNNIEMDLGMEVIDRRTGLCLFQQDQS